MTADRQHWTAERVEELLKDLSADSSVKPPEASERGIWSYVDAAAVLSSFDPERLRPAADDTPRVEGLRRLLEESVPVFVTAGQAEWRLKAPSRRKALERLATRDAILAACERNLAPDHDPLEKAFMDILGGREVDLERCDYSELAQILDAVAALGGIVEGLPEIARVRQAMERRALLAPLQALVGTRFRGRQKELEQLNAYVDLKVAQPRLTIRRQGAMDRPLLIHGVGGIGKSTLLAKFILDLLDRDREIAFAYLDFDRPAVTAADPSSIVLEVARQLAAQSRGEKRQVWDEFHSTWSARIMEFGAAHTETRKLSTQATTDYRLLPTEPVVEDFTRRFLSTFGTAHPLVLAFDTFEEVQYRSHTYVNALWRLLDELREGIPSLRPVLAGRAPIEERPTESLQLTALDKEAAVAFLEAQGITDRETAEMVISRVGSSPLTLSLAAEVVRRDDAGTNALRNLSRRQRLLFFSVDHETAQIELYRRLLRHIHDPNVRKLAHPGLVLRRITPELIWSVLAEPCGLELESMSEAHDLFSKLSAEITLVRVADDGTLEHRADVRRAMLPMLRETEPEAVEKIHRAAVRYFAQSDTVRDRAEEIYHRFALGEDAQGVGRRWLSGVEDRLRNSVGELPPNAQTYLASRVGVELDPEMWRSASREDLERHATLRAEESLELGDPRGALRVLGDVEDRARGSRLFLLEARAHRELGNPKAALETANAALSPAPDRGSGGTTIELLSLTATIELDMGNREEAVQRIDDAYEVSRWLENDRCTLEVGAQRLALWRACARIDPRGQRRATTEVQHDVSGLDEEALAANPAAAHSVAAELGADYPGEIARIARAAGLPQLRVDRVRRATVLWNRELKGKLERDAAAQRLMRSESEMSAPVAMDILLGLFDRHELTAGAAGSIASEIRHALAAAESPITRS